jgi:hypothetical protein
MIERTKDKLTDAREIARWENEGGALADGDCSTRQWRALLGLPSRKFDGVAGGASDRAEGRIAHNRASSEGLPPPQPF